MKKVWCIILSIVTVMSLSACGKEESALVKQYGQEMVKYYGEEKVNICCSFYLVQQVFTSNSTTHSWELYNY